MNSTKTTTLLSITLSAVLLSGLIAPSLPQAFAGVEDIPCDQINGEGISVQDDICFPPFFLNSNTVFRQGGIPDIVNDAGRCGDVCGPNNDQPCSGSDWQSTNTAKENGQQFTGTQDDFPFPLKIFGNPTEPTDTQATITFGGQGAAVRMPNLIDELPFKDIRVQMTFCPIGDPSNPITSENSGVTDLTPNPEGQCTFVGAGDADAVGGAFTTGATFFFEDWHCQPNPDYETFNVSYDTSQWLLVQLAFDSWTYDVDVGGIFEGVNTPALLVAGAQANALWLIPLITAIGIGIVVVNRKRFF